MAGPGTSTSRPAVRFAGVTAQAGLGADDPQGRDAQAGALAAAGADVFASNAQATRHAVALVRAADTEGAAR